MIAVLGAGKSGMGAALLAKKNGLDVFVSEIGRMEDSFRDELTKHNIRFEEGKHSEDIVLAAHEVIKSPGIPDTVPIMKKILNKKIPVISEIEFAGRYTSAKKICVTGSNGKTTTSTLVDHVFSSAGYCTGLAGNIGMSLGRLLAENPGTRYDFLVIELSSFQLDNMYRFKADVAIITNITRNHMNRYDNSMQQYIDSKFRITRNQGKDDALIYFLDNPVLKDEVEKRNLPMKIFPYSGITEIKEGAYLKDDRIISNIHNQTTSMFIHELSLIGKHNAFNSMAAIVAARYFDINNDTIRKALSDVHQVEHRMEYVATVKGIDFINDSKSTTADATWWALESTEKPVILIMGGEDNKGNDYTALEDLMKRKVKTLICIGKDNSKILKAFRRIVDPIFETPKMEEAVLLGYRLGKKGDVVLLSPGCSSFDLYKNFEDRGRQFKKAVKAL